MSLLTTDTKQEKAYIRVLKAEFKMRQNKNQKYSLRAFAHFLGLAHSTLSLIMSDQKGMSDAMAHKVAEKLALSHSEKEVFTISVAKHCARSPEARVKAAKKLRHLKQDDKIKVLSPETIKNINHWVYIAAFELISTNQATTAEAIATTINIPLIKITKVINTLLELSVITDIDNKLTATSSAIQTFNDIPSSSIVQYHISVSEKAIESIKNQKTEEREFQNTILSVAESQLPQAKKMIRDFIHHFNIELQNDKPAGKVYSLSASFFRLS